MVFPITSSNFQNRRLGNRMVFVIGLILLFMGWQSCSELDEGVPTGAFDYTAYDSLYTKLITGWFTMVLDSDSTITGEWHFTNVGDVRDDIGPQLGDGTIEGNLSQNAFYLNLNPEWADNNVFLVGFESNGSYSGMWMFSTLTGATNQGPFIATRHR